MRLLWLHILYCFRSGSGPTEPYSATGSVCFLYVGVSWQTGEHLFFGIFSFFIRCMSDYSPERHNKFVTRWEGKMPNKKKIGKNQNRRRTPLYFSIEQKSDWFSVLRPWSLSQSHQTYRLMNISEKPEITRYEPNSSSFRKCPRCLTLMERAGEWIKDEDRSFNFQNDWNESLTFLVAATERN